MRSKLLVMGVLLLVLVGSVSSFLYIQMIPERTIVMEIIPKQIISYCSGC